MSHLASLGNFPGYQHKDKRIAPGEGLRLSRGFLKWYDVDREDVAITADFRGAARAYLLGQDQAGLLDVKDELGFVILHRCSASFTFLIVCTWRGHNEIWQTVFYEDTVGGGFHLWPRQGPHLPTFCVWELGAVWHEQGAWRTYLLSARDLAAKEAYLGDQYAGPV